MAAAAVTHPHHYPSSAHVHGRIHKRGRSASSLPSTDALVSKPLRKASQPTLDDGGSNYNSGSTSRLKIKPYLRKLSLKDHHLHSHHPPTLDLSRPLAENESIAGLGIHDFASPSPSRSTSDLVSPFSPLSATAAGGPPSITSGGASRSRHARSTSNTSHLSTTSSLHRPTVPPYVHPMRQTPRPYTPPIGRSYTASTSEVEEADEVMTDEEFRARQRSFDPARRSGSISSQPSNHHLHPQQGGPGHGQYAHPTHPPPPIYIPAAGTTSTSLTRLTATANPSQSSLVSGSRSRGDTLRSVDTATVSPSSRTSMDRTTLNATGSGSGTLDPTTRAASIRAARLAFLEREEAKERKAEKEMLKQLDRANRRRERREERLRRKSEDTAGTISAAAAASTDAGGAGSNEKLEFMGKSYADTTPAHARSLPRPATVVPPPPSAGAGAGAEAIGKVAARRSGRGVKSRWLGFLAWFRTRLLRMGRRVHGRN